MRGSAAGSLVCYTAGITDIDPLHYGLIFERFLNPSRYTMPDIDVDLMDVRRNEVIEYVTEKYGADHVAQIITFGTMKARAAVRDVGRALGMTYGEVDRVAKLVPTMSTVDDALRDSQDLQQLVADDPQVQRLLDLAKEPGRRGASCIHPCGGGGDFARASHRVRPTAAQRGRRWRYDPV